MCPPPHHLSDKTNISDLTSHLQLAQVSWLGNEMARALDFFFFFTNSWVGMANWTAANICALVFNQTHIDGLAVKPNKGLVGQSASQHLTRGSSCIWAHCSFFVSPAFSPLCHQTLNLVAPPPPLAENPNVSVERTCKKAIMLGRILQL